MVKPVINLLVSHISHMALHTVFRESGVTQEHGFELNVHVTGVNVAGQPFITFEQRAPKLLEGTYDFISGLHHEPYHYRARGDKRFVYLAQSQNDWDDRIVATDEIQTPKDLEGKRFVVSGFAPCVYGNLCHSLEAAGVNLSRVEFIDKRGNRLGRSGPWRVERNSPASEARPRENDPRRKSREEVDAVVGGLAAAASVDAPFDLYGEKLGLHILDIPSIPVIHNTTVCANLDWIQRNEDTTMAFLKGMIDTIHFFKTEPSRTCEILEQHLAPVLGLEGADEVEHLQEVWASLLSPKPYPHPLAVWNVYNLDVAHDPEVNFINPFEIWDTSYLRAVDDSGYVDKMYGGAKAATNPAVNPVS